MKNDEVDNFTTTIQPILTYRSRIIRHKSINSNNQSNINLNNSVNLKQNNPTNKIEKACTQIKPINNDLKNNINIIVEQKEIPKKKEKIKKNLSSYDIFVPKNIKNFKNLYQPSQKQKHTTFNDIKKKRRNNSLPNKSNINNINNINNNNDKIKKKYDYSCVNCYNNKIATKKLIEQQLEQKIILNNTFNKMDPFYFQDKMKDLYKNKINHKIKELEKIQRQALSNLAKYKLENPSDVEKLQNQCEKSLNPMNAYEREDPRIGKTIKAYDKKENFINDNKDLYQFNKPRKAINDYYKKCVFQMPKIEKEYMVDPEYTKQVNIDLMNQIEENKNIKRMKKEEEINIAKISQQKMEAHEEFFNKKNYNDKKSYLDEFFKKNKYIDGYKKIKKEQEKTNLKIFSEEINKKMRKEDEELKIKNKQKKLNNINKYQNWKNNFENEKNNRKKEKQEEDSKWYNYSINYINKCIHGNEVTKCSLCNRNFPNEKLVKYIAKSTDFSSNAQTSRINEKA